MPDTNCPYCGIGIIGKIVTYELKISENYLEGLVIITTYICLRCQAINHQNRIICALFRQLLHLVTVGYVELMRRW